MKAIAEIKAWDGLIAVLRRAERFGDLVQALERHAAMAERERAREDLVETARLYGAKLNEPEKAVETWLDVRKRFGVGDESFSEVARLFEAKGRWEDLARLTLDEAKVLLEHPAMPGAEGRLVLQKKKAELAIEHLLDRALAIAVCQQLFDVSVACWIRPFPTIRGAPPRRSGARPPFGRSISWSEWR